MEHFVTFSAATGVFSCSHWVQIYPPSEDAHGKESPTNISILSTAKEVYATEFAS